jgi:hypothetical protein
MSSKKAEEYRKSYEEYLKLISFGSLEECVIESLRYLIEDMIETIQELEESASKEYRAKQVKLQASARTGIN